MILSADYDCKVQTCFIKEYSSYANFLYFDSFNKSLVYHLSWNTARVVYLGKIETSSRYLFLRIIES